MANEHLDRKIGLPACCDPEKLMERIRTFPISEPEMLNVYNRLYKGNKDTSFGSVVRKIFSKDSFDEAFEKAVKDDSYAAVKQAMDIKGEEIEKRCEEYDISDPEDLPYYEVGDSIHPKIAEWIGNCFAFYRSILKEEDFAKLMNKSPRERCEWLVFQNRRLLLRDKDWDKIFGDILENPESFARYYPCVRVKIIGEEQAGLVRAIVTNDAFYQYTFSLEKESGSEEEGATDA